MTHRAHGTVTTTAGPDENSIGNENDFAPRPATTLLRLQNKESDGLGKPLPAGVVSIMETGDGGATERG